MFAPPVKHWIPLSLLCLGTATLFPACAPVRARASEEHADSVSWIKIRTNEGVILAAVARPHGPGPFPTLVILHGTHGFAQEYVQLARDMAHHRVLGVAVCWFAGRQGVGVRFVTPIECPDGPPLIDTDGAERFRASRRRIDLILDSLRVQPDVDKHRVALFGHSRGGGAALDYAFLHTGKVRAAILNSTGYPDEVISRASEVDLPLLILHGTADNPRDGGSPRTDIQQVRKFEAALRREGKDVEAKYYVGGGHNSLFSNSTQYRDAVQRIVAFLRRH